MDYKKVSRMKRRAIAASNTTRQERMPRSRGRRKYTPAKTHRKSVPHRENPKTTKAIFTTNFMLIGR
ncbi:MAG: hypothetical protein BGN96_04295 [Bacteroidales bacterium 45-6]|nr:MAG: hypothetical protein BGN96_04295 [Bacteroidales bacterium 45-6]